MVHEGDTLVTSVVPGLSSKTGVALPDLHLGTIGGRRASIKTVVGTSELDGGLTVVDDPVLGAGSVAVVAVIRILLLAEISEEG